MDLLTFYSPGGYLQDPLFSCLSIKHKIPYLENFMSGFLQSNLLWETELWMSAGQQLLCNRRKSQEWVTSSSVTSGIIIWSGLKGNFHILDTNCTLRGVLGEETAVK